MSDRLKFRVWDTIYKQWSNKENDDPLFIGNDGLLYWPNTYSDDLISAVEDQGDYVIQQCTGLKDIKGKLIFEGDIVKSSSVLYTIINDEKLAKPYCEIGVVKWNNLSERLSLGVSFGANFCSVIGNIFENPDFLEK